MPEIGQSENGPNIVNDEATTDVPSNYLICDMTGFKIRVDEGLVEDWRGYKMRKESWSPRHPQDFVRSKAEKLTGSPRPEQEDTFVDAGDVTPSDL